MKLRFEVEAQRSPGGTRSGFIARHIGGVVDEKGARLLGIAFFPGAAISVEPGFELGRLQLPGHPPISNPDAMRGRPEIERYWADAVEGQAGVSFSSEILACTGRQGLCHWHVAFERAPDGGTVELDGILRCLFSDDGRVETFQEWWHVRA